MSEKKMPCKYSGGNKYCTLQPFPSNYACNDAIRIDISTTLLELETSWHAIEGAMDGALYWTILEINLLFH